jgi:hypothetical protein
MIERVPISSIKPNPANPRVIRDAAFNSLKRSLDEFPEMMEIRPIAVRQGVILGGNMRYRAAQALGWTHAHVIHCDSLTDEQAQRFIIADNVTPGEWDWEALANEWDAALLEDWGVSVPDITNANEGDEIEFPQSLQVFPKMEYVIICANSESEEWEEIRALFKCGTVRQGGCKVGSTSDAATTGLERVFDLKTFKERIGI